MSFFFSGLALINQQQLHLAQTEFEGALKNDGRLAPAHQSLDGIDWRHKD